MWKQEGFQGFMKGNGINVIRVSLDLRAVIVLALIELDPSLLRFAVHSKLPNLPPDRKS